MSEPVLSGAAYELWRCFETSLKRNYKLALEILAEVADQEDATVEKLIQSVPESEKFAPFLYVVDDESYKRFRARILDMANEDLRELRRIMAEEFRIVPQQMDVVQIGRRQ